jgi:gluconate 2-dehydrogenase gamma chain
LTADEQRVLHAALSRLIPSDECGPGALEAGVARYVEQTVAFRPELAPQVAVGLRALAAEAVSRFDRSFVELDPAGQDDLLASLEDEAPGCPEEGTFFEVLRELALQGMFGDPSHGGNADGAGWALLGYPGVRLLVDAEAQQIHEAVGAAP